MSSRRTSSVPKEDVVFPRMLYCDSRSSQMLPGLSPALPGALLCNATCRRGDGKRVILHHRVRGSIKAVRAVRNTRVFQTETRVVPDVLSIPGNIQHIAQRQSQHKQQWSMLWNRTFRHFWLANTAHQHIVPQDDILKRMMGRATWRQRESEHLGHCAACDQKRGLGQRNYEQHTC